LLRDIEDLSQGDMTYHEWIEHLESKIEILDSIIELAEQEQTYSRQRIMSRELEISKENSYYSFVKLFNEEQDVEPKSPLLLMKEYSDERQ